MEKIWLKSYPQGVPKEIEALRHSSLPSLLEDVCEEFAERPAFGNFGSYLSFAELDAHARAFAAWLQQSADLSAGDRVALMMPNVLAYPVALFGVLLAGGVVVNTNPQYTASELRHQLQDSGATVLVVFEQSLETVAPIRAEFPYLRLVVTRVGDLMPWPKALLFNRIAARGAGKLSTELDGLEYFTKALGRGRELQLRPPQIDLEDLAFLQYTGGTTGRSKGAMLSHRNILSNVAQINAWYGPLTNRGEEIIITALPLYHIYALSGNCFAFLATGGMNYLITDPRNLKTFIKELKRVRFTALSGVNTLFNALLQQAEFHNLDFSALKFTSGGGMAVQQAVAEQWQALTGKPISEGYGLTESSPVVAANPFDAVEFSGCIGFPMPSTEVRLVDDDGELVDRNCAGELCVRGPQVMRGYWNNPDATAEVLDHDGWLRTGDIALLQDDGNLRIVDRKKDLIVVSGFNVYPNELEDVAVNHPQIVEAAAVGLEDSKSGESVCLVVVRSDDDLSEQAVIDWCRIYLTGYKIPRRVIFTDELPKSNVGKVLRREVRQQFSETAS